ncbi:MAG: phosphomannomutase/phosphoglucomutase [Polyangiaceae bacterium]
MKIPRHIFREYDVRGVADRDLSDELAYELGCAFAAMLASDRPRPVVAVSRDGRVSSPRLFDSLVRGLRSGADVLSIGIGPSPQLYFAAHHLGTDGAVMITGSHNPAPDNGFKMMRGKSSFFGPDIQRLAERMEASDGSARELRGALSEVDVSDAYVDKLRASSRLTDAARRVPFVVDAGNGAAGPLATKVFTALGLTFDPMFCAIDGTFPNHHPDPTVPKNLDALRERVLSTKAPFGVAFDGDGDRLGAIDENGDIVWGDKLMILYAREVLRENPGATILGEVKCSETLFDDVRKHGGRALYAKTGHSLIKTRMKEEHALLAGEMSGHLFFADRFLGFDDATYAALRLLEIVAASGKRMSELLADVPRTFATPELRFDCPDALKFDVVARVREHFKALYPVLELDGARVDFGDGAWGLCRASNTQPILVLRFEAKTEARANELRAEVEAVADRALAELKTRA